MLSDLQKLAVHYKKWMFSDDPDDEDTFIAHMRRLLPSIKGHEELKEAFEEWQAGVAEDIEGESDARDSFIRVAERELKGHFDGWFPKKNPSSDLYGEMSFLIFTIAKDIDGAIQDLLEAGFRPKEMWDTLQKLRMDSSFDPLHIEDWEKAMNIRGWNPRKMRSNPMPRGGDFADFWVAHIKALAHPERSNPMVPPAFREMERKIQEGKRGHPFLKPRQEDMMADLRAEMEKEQQEHPSLPINTIEQIAKDHLTKRMGYKW